MCVFVCLCVFFFFFFQAEDGIRDWSVTGVQTCALPIYEERKKLDEARREFDEYVRELRRARDREEFESFKTNWTSARTENGENSTA